MEDITSEDGKTVSDVKERLEAMKRTRKGSD